MGSAAKSKRHAEKMKKHRDEKRAKQTLYMSLAGTGKKKRRATVYGSKVGNHINGTCGNIGCAKCAPQYSLDSEGLALPGVKQHLRVSRWPALTPWRLA